MEREIRYRGKGKETKLWIYGSLLVQNDKYFIIIDVEIDNKNELGSMSYEEVYPESVGIYTEVKDEDEAEVYEKDIILVKELDNKTWKVKEWISVVSWEGGAFVFDADDKKSQMWLVEIEDRLFTYPLRKIHVIGNSYENGDLLHELLYQGKSVEEALEGLKDNE